MSTRTIVLAGAALVGVSTAATSAASLYQLAQLCGIPGFLAAALPIALDAGAGVAALVWITEKGSLREWGRWLAISTLAASLAGNGIQHAITSGLLEVTLPLVLLVGACIPACLWAVVHLAALMAKAPVKAPAAKPKPQERPRPVTPPEPVADPAPKAEPAAVDDELGSTRELVAQIMAEEGCSQRTAYRRLAERRKAAS